MKKLFIITVLVAIAMDATAQFMQKPKQVHKHYIYYEDSIPNNMDFVGTFSYNDSGQITEFEDSKAFGNFGSSYYSKKYWYDNANRLIKYSYGGYDGGGIYGVDSVFYVYDEDHLTYTKKLYVNKWGGWYFTDSTAYSYNDKGELERIENYGITGDYYSWSTVPNAITEYIRTEEGTEKIHTVIQGGAIRSRTTTYYDTDEHVLDYVYELYNNGNSLMNGDKKTYSYVDGLCQSMIYQKWSPDDSCWANYYHYDYQYNDMGVKTEEVAHAWLDDNWQNSRQTLWDFNEDGSCHSITYKDWSDGEFVNSQRVEYTFDENGLCIGLQGMVWSDGAWTEGIGGRNETLFWDESLQTENELINSSGFSFSDVTITWQTIYPKFQPGSEWYYEIQNDNGSITYQHLEYAADTTIGSQRPKIIVRSNTHYDRDTVTKVTHEYIYEENGKVYWWNKDLEEFTTLYDLGANVGDEWEIKVGTESITMHVDSVENYDIEGKTYRMLHVSDAQDLFSGDIVCDLGHLTSFFPEKLMRHNADFTVNGLRCFWIGEDLLYHNGEEDCDSIYSELHGVEEDGPSTGSEAFTVYPNPTNNVLFVQTLHATSLPAQYHITNLIGQNMLTGNISDGTQLIDIESLPAGMYFISVGEQTVKFVKQ